jgi:hypothetical protein
MNSEQLSSTTPDRTATNRANASRSTGPRAEAGTVRSGSTAANQAIARSRWNALTHGLYARVLSNAAAVLEEDLTEFQSLREALLEEYAPEDLAEERMVEKMALLCWQHDRLMAHSEQRLADCLKAGDDIVTALMGREATTMAESRLDRVISRIHRDLLFLARYRERARQADERERAREDRARTESAASPVGNGDAPENRGALDLEHVGAVQETGPVETIPERPQPESASGSEVVKPTPEAFSRSEELGLSLYEVERRRRLGWKPASETGPKSDESPAA